jgi:hypothetical protein
MHTPPGQSVCSSQGVVPVLVEVVVDVVVLDVVLPPVPLPPVLVLP